MAYYLRMGSDCLEYAVRHNTKASALAEFREAATELERYDQRIEASLHIAATRDEVAEYPDFVLSLGPRGGLRIEST